MLCNKCFMLFLILNALHLNNSFVYITKWVSEQVSSKRLFVVSRPCRRVFFIPFNMMRSHAWLLDANANKTDRLLGTSLGLFHVLAENAISQKLKIFLRASNQPGVQLLSEKSWNALWIFTIAFIPNTSQQLIRCFTNKMCAP